MYFEQVEISPSSRQKKLKGTLMQIWKSPYMFVLHKINTLKVLHF